MDGFVGAHFCDEVSLGAEQFWVVEVERLWAVRGDLGGLDD